MPKSRAKLISYVAAGFVVFFWAAAFPGVRYSLQYYSPVAIMLFRFLIASAVLLGYCVCKKIPPPRKGDLPLFMAAGFIGIFLYMWAFITGTSFVSAGISSFIISTAPLLTLILSIVFLKEKAGFSIWFGVLVGFGGIGIISFAQLAEGQLNIGILLLLAAACCTSISTIVQKYILSRYTAIQSAAYSIAFAALCMSVFMPRLVREFLHVPMHVNLFVIYLGMFPAASAYFLWNLALSKAEKTVHVTSFMYIIPFLASVIAFFWLGEEMSALALFGGVVIIAGMVIINFRQFRPAKQESAGETVNANGSGHPID